MASRAAAGSPALLVRLWAEAIDLAHLVGVRHRASSRAALALVEGAPQIVRPVLGDRLARSAVAGRAQVDEPVLAHVKEAGPGPALPVDAPVAEQPVLERLAQ